MFTFEVTRTKPFAPSELEGEYKLTIKGRKMKMEKLDDGIKVQATCNKTDDWNMVDGINVCLDRMKAKQDAAKEIKVGDIVQVVNSCCKYPKYVEWVVKNVDNKKDVACFAHGSMDNLNGKDGVVVAISPHDNGDNIAYVRMRDGRRFLFAMDGLKKI